MKNVCKHSNLRTIHTILSDFSNAVHLLIMAVRPDHPDSSFELIPEHEFKCQETGVMPEL